MATSMQFGPEWMRKAPAKNANGSVATTPSASGRGESSSAAPSSAGSGGKKNGSIPNLSGLNGPAPVTSPSVSSLGAFSFAAAAGGAAAAAAAAGSERSSSTGTAGAAYDADGAIAALANGAAAAKDKQSREKLLSLYSTDRSVKSPSSDPPTAENGAAGRKKLGLERDQRRPSNFSDLGSVGVSGPLSPSLGGEARGLNTRSTSGGSSGGFGSAGTSNWDKADKERPGLFQRASSNTLATVANNNNARPLSPSVSRDRFGGIQGGVLSGVAPPARKRMDSENGSSDPIRPPRNARGLDEPSAAGSWNRGGGAFSDAFSSNRIRGKSGTDGLGIGSGNHAGHDSEGGSISARFGGRNKERGPGEGPIGPPADGSAGFNKFAGYDRKRERQASHARTGVPGNESGGAGTGTTGDGNEEHQRDARSSYGHGDDSLSQHATSVLSSLKLDDEDPSAANFASSSDANSHVSASQPAWSVETAFWLYRDPSGQVQGPFAAAAMQDWYRQNYFSDDLLVKRQEDDEFRPLAQTIAAIGNALQPFLTPPSEWLQKPYGSRASHLDTSSSTGLGSQQDSHSVDAEHGSRFAPQMDPSRNWAGSAGQAQQWPSQLSLGFGQPAPQPMSPFGRPDLFGQPGMRTQEDLVALIREREMQEQHKAAAAAAARFGQLDPFVAGLAGRTGWDAAGANSWMQHGGLPSFDPAFAGHGSPMAGQERQVFDAFNQRPVNDQSAAWSNKGTSTPRSQFEQQASFQRGNQWKQQGAWSGYGGNMTPEPQHRQVQDLQDAGLRNEALKQFSDPIGTPRRARSPAPSSSHHQHASEHIDEKAPETLDGAGEGLRREEAAQDDYISSQQPNAEAVQAAIEEAVEEARQAEEAHVAEREPVSTEKTLPDVVEPKAPALPSVDSRKKGGETPQNAESKRSVRGQSAEVKTIPGAAEQPSRAQARQTPSSGNVKVVSQEQFRRNKDAEIPSSVAQAPLSAWLPETANESQSSAPKAAPWAAREEVQATSSPGPSLREIQEAEARRAEARKAAERAAAAAQRARAAAIASNNDDLPTSMSWGLASVPSSTTTMPSGDQGAPGLGSGPNTPAWNAGKANALKKTLMEIQEEERRRAEKQKQQQAAQAMALRKGYADSASRTAVPSASAGSGGAWSVVGSSGKPNPPPSSSPSVATRAPVALAAQRTSSVGVVPSAGSAWSTVGAKPSTPATPSRVVSQPAAVSSTVSALKPKPAASLDPNSPSPEFIKYLKDNLKGLSIKADDFIEMLLSFPMDPSPDVIEIIAESVYANSSTLDGRRFAADFVTKRKMDVQGRNQAASAGSKWSTMGSSGGMGSFGSGSSKQPAMSAAEIMKSQASSKAAAADTGFKVVKTKGSKKRAN